MLTQPICSKTLTDKNTFRKLYSWCSSRCLCTTHSTYSTLLFVISLYFFLSFLPNCPYLPPFFNLCHISPLNNHKKNLSLSSSSFDWLLARWSSLPPCLLSIWGKVHPLAQNLITGFRHSCSRCVCECACLCMGGCNAVAVSIYSVLLFITWALSCSGSYCYLFTVCLCYCIVFMLANAAALKFDRDNICTCSGNCRRVAARSVAYRIIETCYRILCYNRQTITIEVQLRPGPLIF